jgi:hypothetical protein
MAVSSRPNDYERSDASPRLIGVIALGLALFLGLTPFVLRLIYPSVTRPQITGALPQPPQPRLETVPRASLAALHARERELLARYGWVDRPHGVVRVPIDRAVELLSRRGLPAWPAQTTSAK